MRKRIFIYALVLTGLFFCPAPSSAQNHDEILTTFPNVDVVYTNYDKKLTISKKEGAPVASSEYTLGMMMLSDKNSNMVSRYSVHHSEFNELASMDAYTQVPIGKNKYKNVKVKDTSTTSSTSSNIFYDDSKETVFNFPSLVQYAVANLNYTLLHKDAHLLTPFYIPSGAPAMSTTFTVVVPDGVDIRYIVQNDFDNQFVFTKEKKSKETHYKWTATKVKTTDRYGNAPSFRYYQPHVIVHITGYQTKEGYVSFLNDVKDLYKWNISFTKNLNTKEDASLKLLVDSLTNNQPDAFSKAASIYRWVQEHIRYIAFEDGLQGFTPRQASDIYVKRYGDCKDMTSILVVMLRLAEIPAYYTWIGTRDIPYRYEEIPLPLVDNHMIATIQLDGKWYFLDGTNSYAYLTLPPSAIQGKEALVAIDDANYKILTVPVAAPEYNKIVDSTFIQLTSNGIKGFQKVDYSGYFGLEVLTSIKYRNETEKEKYVKSRMGKGSNKFQLGKFSIDHAYPVSKTAQISAEFEIPDYGKKIGDAYYINPNLEKLVDIHSLLLEKRKIPVEHEFKYQIVQHHILEIPENYMVTHLPEDLFAENEFISIRISYKINNNTIIATQEMKNNSLMVYPSDFEKWNAVLKLAISKNKETLVLEPKK